MEMSVTLHSLAVFVQSLVMYKCGEDGGWTVLRKGDDIVVEFPRLSVELDVFEFFRTTRRVRWEDGDPHDLVLMQTVECDVSRSYYKSHSGCVWCIEKKSIATHKQPLLDKGPRPSLPDNPAYCERAFVTMCNHDFDVTSCDGPVISARFGVDVTFHLSATISDAGVVPIGPYNLTTIEVVSISNIWIADRHVATGRIRPYNCIYRVLQQRASLSSGTIHEEHYNFTRQSPNLRQLGHGDIPLYGGHYHHSLSTLPMSSCNCYVLASDNMETVFYYN